MPIRNYDIQEHTFTKLIATYFSMVKEGKEGVWCVLFRKWIRHEKSNEKNQMTEKKNGK